MRSFKASISARSCYVSTFMALLLTNQPSMVRLSAPRDPYAERPGLVVGHLGREPAKRKRSGMLRRMRIGGLVIAIIAAKFITPGSFPGETGRAVEMRHA
jgi:hypothetical protein